MQITITGSGFNVPEQIITNDELVTSFNQYVDHFNTAHASEIASGKISELTYSDAAFIEKASGIKQRHVLNKSGILNPDRLFPLLPSRSNDEISTQVEMALPAIHAAMEQAGVSGEDIDGVICASTSMQRTYPTISVEAQKLIGAQGFAFDLQMACSSATFGIQTAYSLLQSGMAKKVLVFSSEICSAQLDFRNRDSHFIFGDAATALVLEADSDKSGFAIQSTRCHTQFSNNIRSNFGFLNHAEAEHEPPSMPLFTQEGRKVFKEVSPMAADHIASHLAEHELAPTDMKRFWLHQANMSMNQLIIKRLLGKDFDPVLAPLVLDRYANTAACGSILAFNHYNQDIQPNEYGVLCSFGAGYSIGSILLKKC